MAWAKACASASFSGDSGEDGMRASLAEGAFPVGVTKPAFVYKDSTHFQDACCPPGRGRKSSKGLSRSTGDGVAPGKSGAGDPQPGQALGVVRLVVGVGYDQR